eukprot:3494956-Prymnesium_polylepis.1
MWIRPSHRDGTGTCSRPGGAAGGGGASDAGVSPLSSSASPSAAGVRIRWGERRFFCGEFA